MRPQKHFRDDGGFRARSGERLHFVRNRDAERSLGRERHPKAMARIGGKAAAPHRPEPFQRFAVFFVRGNIPHDDAQAGIVPLRLKRFLNAAVRTFEVLTSIPRMSP